VIFLPRLAAWFASWWFDDPWTSDGGLELISLCVLEMVDTVWLKRNTLCQMHEIGLYTTGVLAVWLTAHRLHVVIKVLASGPFLHVEVAKLVYLTYWCRA
jgi:hypothetical protein